MAGGKRVSMLGGGPGARRSAIGAALDAHAAQDGSRDAAQQVRGAACKCWAGMMPSAHTVR
jgi:hypothetical protein